MHRSAHSLLHEMEEIFRGGVMPAEANLQALLKLARSAKPMERERALLLLLHPPIEDEIHCQLRLFHQVRRWIGAGVELPVEVWEWLLEWLVFAHSDGSRPRGAEWAALVARAPRAVWREFRKRPFSVRVFLDLRTGGRAFWPGRLLPASCRRQWRLLKRRVRAKSEAELWAEPTLQDFSLFGERSRLKRRLTCQRGRWLRVGRAVTARVAPAESVPVDGVGISRAFKEVYWGGLGPAGCGYLEALLTRQVEELREVRRLSMEVSRATRRVVLSCHNATLAAMGGWAFESVDRQLPDRLMWECFKHRTEAFERAMHRDAAISDPGLSVLWTMWEERLLAPKREQARWEHTLRCWMGRTEDRGSAQEKGMTRILVRPDPSQEPAESAKLGWCGALQPCQHPNPVILEHWRKSRKQQWMAGFHLLRAMLETGGQMLARGEIEHLVLPWIDKFFISSLREQDIGYLAGLMDWIEEVEAQPLVLFWEDSTHHREASFGIALSRVRGRRWRGVGKFDSGSSDRRQAYDIICSEHDRIDLFALRPVSEVHYPASLEQLLRSRPRSFLESYDSAWKDNQVCLYTGTMVFPLISVQCDPEPLPCWVAVDGAALPLGAFIRNRLRRSVLGEAAADGHLDPLLRRYQKWAALD